MLSVSVFSSHQYIVELQTVKNIDPAILYLLDPTLEEVQQIAEKIWYHESAHQPDRYELMTFWNQMEPFPSIGIGHFIWPPACYSGPFASGRFHLVLKFFQEKGLILPKWLVEARYCPWETREAFYSDFESSKMQELRAFLKKNMIYQACYLVEALREFYLHLVSLPSVDQKVIDCFRQVLMTSNGLYVLTDYLNFKDSGFDKNRTYKGQGWGLLQVLQEMDLNIAVPIKMFSEAGKRVLERRVRNALDPEKESIWIPNWFERLDSYCK